VVDAVLTMVSELFAASGAIAADQLDSVRWVRPPVFPMTGRTSWSVLPYPLPTPGLSVSQVSALKLKGIGLGLPDGTAVPPQSAIMRRGREHVTVLDNGAVTTVPSQPAPLGGIFLDRAEAEFRNAHHLVTHGCPSIVPIAVYRYTVLSSRKAPIHAMGAVLTGSPNAEPARASVLFVKAEQEPAFAAAERDRLIAELGGGNLLKAARESRSLEVVRDVASAVYQVARSFLIPGGTMESCHSMADVESASPVTEFLSSYFPERSVEHVARSYERRIFADALPGSPSYYAWYKSARRDLVGSLVHSLRPLYTAFPSRGEQSDA
jgi:hypothetical protein